VHTWSLSAVASIVWVIIAYTFTVVDSFWTVTVSYTADLNGIGQAVGTLFLWLIPIIIGWLQISPKCDSSRLHHAMERANKIAYVATPDGQPTLNNSRKRALYLRKGVGTDEQCSPPVYNYARFFGWTLAVEHVYCAFAEASKRSDNHQAVDSGTEWKEDESMRIHPQNRRGSLAQVAAYITIKPRSRWGPDVVPRFLLATFLALSLTWGTIGAAILIAFSVPTRGIGCRSGSYLIYGLTSTLVWILLVVSSILAHYSTFTLDLKGKSMHTKSTRIAGILSSILRRSAKILASINAIWIILACLLYFGNFFDRCWCNSCALYLGNRAYSVIELLPEDVAALNTLSMGGVSLASGCAILFVGFVSILVNPTLPD